MMRTTRTAATLARAFPAAVLLFVLAPGHGDAWFAGIPIGLQGLAVLAIVSYAWWVTSIHPASRAMRLATLALAALTLVKVVCGVVAPTPGWLGRYYANGSVAGEPRRSTAFPRLADATRIDRAIDFRDDYFPAYFLNDADFRLGIRREVTEPVSAIWTGHTHTSTAALVPLSIEARGVATVALDGTPIAQASGGNAVVRDVILAPGDHTFEVRYRKPADTDPLVRVSGLAAYVAARPASAWRWAMVRPARLAARAVDLLAVVVMAFGVWVMVAAARWTTLRALTAAMFLVFLVQGTLAAAPSRGRAVTLSGGDDWLGYEAASRAVATGDLLVLNGQPPGKGEVFFYYPGYIYFLGAVHAVGGEDLSTPILAHFLLLALTNIVVYHIGVRLFDRRVAIAAVAVLVAIEEVDVIRHYSVTLLTENLYFATIALTIYAFVRYAETGALPMLLASGAAAGISALTRPAMMLYLVPAALVVLLVVYRRRRDPLRAAGAAALFVATWLATLAPATIRNYVAAGSPVLIAAAPVASFIDYNLPPDANRDVYRDRYSGGALSFARTLGSIATDYPWWTLRNVGIKLGFSFGMLQWMGGHVHPELVLASAGYLLAVVSTPSARAMATWPIHAFVLAHLAGMILSMPSNYGYRMILPMYLFFPLFAVRFVSEIGARFSR